MEKEFNLSEKIIFNGLSEEKVKDWKDYDFAIIQRKDVKEFIRLLKEEIGIGIDHSLFIEQLDIIDKFAGDELI